MISIDVKTKIIEALNHNRALYPSDAKHARSLGVEKHQYLELQKRNFKGVVEESKWISLARILNVQLKTKRKWVTVKTPTFEYINLQLSKCQERSLSAIFVDYAGIGKSHSAKYYCSQNSNAVYIDCSQVKTKQKFVRKIAQEFGVDSKGRYADVYAELVYYIGNMTTGQKPLIVLDEAGDLDYLAFLEIKSLWNATEYVCGWYMMGADGLKKKIDDRKDLNKVGYAEIFDRFDNEFKRVSPKGKEEIKTFKLKQVHQVSKANNAQIAPLKMYGITGGSLRKVRKEIEKHSA